MNAPSTPSVRSAGNPSVTQVEGGRESCEVVGLPAMARVAGAFMNFATDLYPRVVVFDHAGEIVIVAHGSHAEATLAANCELDRSKGEISVVGSGALRLFERGRVTLELAWISFEVNLVDLTLLLRRIFPEREIAIVPVTD